ncbi:GmrSD restriction endonuclease domain-containing protein [Pararhizobium gei]|uniref:GmrSD restriction endonuclease domain-containing protein n=1 Tax=Pararhizobium gei TaxID=1395951 RepID=UPI0023DBE3A4|nr:DUF262 domain-containing protein [Rhizobium gei]
MFDSTKQSLKTLLEQVRDGRIQLPEFQRDYVWSEEAVISLLASISKGYPVGALLTLERGGEVDFKPRGVEGATFGSVVPESLLLDGQQRMTSLFQSLIASEPAKLKDEKGKPVQRYFYLDMNAVLSPESDFEESIITIGPEKIKYTAFGKDVEIDLRTREDEIRLCLFPLNQTFDDRRWSFDYQNYWKGLEKPEPADYQQFYNSVIEKIVRYEMPIIRLTKDNGRHAVCTIFEKVNVGGVKLDAFELLTAIFAGTDDGYDLRADWRGAPGKPGRLTRMCEHTPASGVFTKIASTDFLQACTILHTMDRKAQRESEGQTSQVSCKRDELLALPLSAYLKYADTLEYGYRQAAQFLAGQGILYGNDLPYPPQVTVLACVYGLLREKAQNAAVVEKLEKWFWRVILGEFYSSSVESKIARDVPEIVGWTVNGSPPPRSFEEAGFDSSRLYYFRRRQAAPYRGYHALLMKSGCRDFVNGKPFELMTLWQSPIDVHHIFPQSWCKKNQIDAGRMDSIINKTPLSDLTNRVIVRGDAPSVYLKRIESEYNISSDQLDEILRTHLIEPQHLRNDDFEAFYLNRRDALAKLAGKATGRDITVAPTEEVSFAEDDEIELPEDIERIPAVAE